MWGLTDYLVQPVDSTQGETKMLRRDLTVVSPFIQFPNDYYYLSCLPTLRQSYLFPVLFLETFQRLGRT